MEMYIYFLSYNLKVNLWISLDELLSSYCIHCSASKVRHCSWELPFSLKGTWLGLFNFMEKKCSVTRFFNSQLLEIWDFSCNSFYSAVSVQTPSDSLYILLVLFSYFLFSIFIFWKKVLSLSYRNLLRTRRLTVFVYEKQRDSHHNL